MHGTVPLGAEVSNVSTHCLWLLLGDEELAVPFSDFPWFKKATIEQIAEVQRPTEDHLYWPQLDVDLSINSIHKPKSFPLVSRDAAWPRAQAERQRQAISLMSKPTFVER